MVISLFYLFTVKKHQRLKFYNKKDYIFWAWKGNYINLGAGAELGIYHGSELHWKVDKGLAMEMSMSLKYNGNNTKNQTHFCSILLILMEEI